MQKLKSEIGHAIRALLIELHGQAPERVAVEYPPNPSLGDLASPVGFELARTLRKAPRVIAQELAAALRPPPGVVRVEAGGAGYLNFFIDRAALVLELAREVRSPNVAPATADRGLALKVPGW